MCFGRIGSKSKGVETGIGKYGNQIRASKSTGFGWLYFSGKYMLASSSEKVTPSGVWSRVPLVHFFCKLVKVFPVQGFIINVQNRRQTWRKSTLGMTESQNNQFVLNKKFQRPVKISKDGCNVLRTVLNFLKTIYLIRSDTSQGWITKIKT